MVLTKSTAVLKTDRFAAKFESDIDGGSAVGVNPEKIQVQHVGCEHIPLHLANDGLVNGAVQFDVDDGGAVSDKLFNDLFADGDGDAGLTETVQICRDPSGTANQPGAFGPGNRTTFHL
jgi:hypothetical protein